MKVYKEIQVLFTNAAIHRYCQVWFGLVTLAVFIISSACILPTN